MSTTIDQKVVEMRFDNRHFEQHTRESMSTLDKLKQKLNLTGATKGIEELNTSANRVNMGGMSRALDTIHAKFSALQVMGVTALANITNSAVNAGRRIAKALTIDPVMSGFQEYETQINAVQTILANTQKEGTDITRVNAALDELNEYADQTIYNFTEMTRNIGTFTAAGVKLDDSVAAIKGISNLAAMSGSSSQQASTAMYQLSQALANGKANLQDWNSVVNAGMGGQVFQDALKRTAKNMGTNVDALIKKYGSFRESIGRGDWLTTEVLTKTLEQFTMAAEEGSEQWEKYKKSLMDDGYTAKQAEEILKLANSATDAATKVKTFTQLWDVVKESVQSGWAQTWRLIVGDFEEAKALFTPIADFLTGKNGILTRMSNARNELIKGALSFNPFTSLLDKLENSGIGKVAKKVNGITRSLEEYQKVVNDVWRGKYNSRGDNPDRFDLLEKAGWNPHAVQNLVNKGYKYKLTVEDIEKAEKKWGVTTAETTKNVDKLTNAQLKNAGLTKDEIEMYRELEKQSKKTGKSIDEIVKSMSEKDGRTLLIESFKNIGSTIAKVLNSIGEAWNDGLALKPIELYNFIAGLNELSKHFVISDETADKFTRTLKGIFAIIDLLSMVLGGGLRIAFHVVKAILSAFNMDILDFTALIGDAVVKLRNWVEEHNYLGIAIEKSVKFITKIVTAVKDWITSNETIMNGISKFKEEMKGFGGGLQTWFKGLKEADNVPLYIIQGLVNGLKNGAGAVIDAIISIGKGLLEGICEVLRIKSPSKEFEEVGKFSIEGLINGIKENAPKLFDVIKRIGSKFLSLFEEIDLGDIIIAGGVFGLVGGIKDIIKVVQNVTAPFEGVNKILENVAGVVNSFKSMLDNIGTAFKDMGKAQKMKAVSSVLKSLALVIVVLVGSVYLLSKMEPGKLWASIGAIAVLTALAGGLFALVSVLGTGDKNFKSSIQSMLLLSSITGAIFKLALSVMMLTLLPIGKMWSAIGAIAVLSAIAAGLYILVVETDSKPTSFKSSIKSILGLSAIAGALFTMALAVRILATANPAQLATAIIGFTYMVAVMGLLLIAFNTIAKDNKTSNNISQIAGMLLKMSVAMLILAVVTKIMAKLSVGDMLKGGAFMLAFAGFVKLMVMAAGVDKDKSVYKIGGMLIAISVAMLLMVAVIKLVSLLKIGELIKGAAFMLGFVGFVKLLVMVLKVGKEQTMAKVGATLLAISAAMLIMTAVIKIIGGMDIASLVKGAIGMAYLTGIIILLVQIVQTSKDAPKIAGVLMALSVAIGIMALSTKLLSTISIPDLIKGVGAITLLAIIMALMMETTRGMTGSIGSLIVMTVAIGVMAIAVGVLSRIPFKKLAGATVGLGTLMGVFTIMAKFADNANKSIVSLVVLTAVVVALGVILINLSKLPIDQTLGAATALSVLLGTITGVTLLLSKTGGLNAKALLGLIGLAAIIGMLYLVVDVLKRMDGLQNGAQNAMVLAAFMAVLSLVLLATAGVGAIYTATFGIAATGLIGLVAIIGMLYLVVDVLKRMSEVQSAITNLNALASFLKTLTGILVILAIVGPFALIGVTALAGLTGLMFAIGAFAVAVGSLMEKFPALQSFLNTGLPVLILLAGGIGKMIGAFVSGVMTQIASSLPAIGLMLSQFIINATPFIIGAQTVNKKVLEGIGILAAAIIALTVADLIEGVTTFLSGGKSFATLGTELSKFMINALPFITIANTIRPGVLDGVKSLAEAILIITGANLLDGLNKLLSGQSSLESFGTQLTFLGLGLKKFITAIGPVSDKQISAAESAAAIIKTLASVASELPNTGGLLGSLVGNNDMSTWAMQLPLVAAGIVGFTRIISESKIGKDAIGVAETAAKIITVLAQASSEIDNTGGLLAKLVGDNDLKTFASGLPKVGEGIAGFVSAMSNANITEDQAKVADTAAKIIKTLAQTSKDIDNTGGALAALIGDNDLKKFAKGLPDVGEGIAGFCSKVSELSDSQVRSVNAATKMLTAIVNLGELNLGKYAKSLSGFGDKLKDFATKFVEFVSSINSISSFNIVNAMNGVNQLIVMAKTVAETNLKSLSTFSDSLKKLGTDGVEGFVGAFTGETPKTKVVAGVKEITDAVTKALSSPSFKFNINSAGMAVTTGFATGITADIKSVTAAGTAIGKEALRAAKEAINSNSPSKEAMKIGNYFGQGLVIGIQDYESKSYDAGYGVAEYAKNGLSKAVSRISDLMNNNIDTQPTIRPVLDLSDIESGAGYLNTMFNNNPSIGANLNAISSSMNARSQNGVNSDVVTAIDSLRKELGNVGGTTNNYNVNGVSYADTDNDINNAVKTLVRAAVVERRI